MDEENLDVLQNIELMIVLVHRDQPSLLDMDVKDALDLLIRHYRAEEEQMRPPASNLGDLAQKVFESVHEKCEWRLGRSSRAGDEREITIEEPILLSELIDCLRKIQKSVRLWTKEGGREGYLNFVQQYVR